jgi:hypothetical protein
MFREMGDRADVVRSYLERVVNQRDLTAVDDLVSPDYRGSGLGWPADLAGLRAFYAWQAQTRPDWHVDVRDAIEVADVVVVRAEAGGTIAQDEQGRPLAAPASRSVEWLAAYTVTGGRVTAIDLLALSDRSGGGS